MEEFRLYEKMARLNKRGLWGNKKGGEKIWAREKHGLS